MKAPAVCSHSNVRSRENYPVPIGGRFWPDQSSSQPVKGMTAVVANIEPPLRTARLLGRSTPPLSAVWAESFCQGTQSAKRIARRAELQLSEPAVPFDQCAGPFAFALVAARFVVRVECGRAHDLTHPLPAIAVPRGEFVLAQAPTPLTGKAARLVGEDVFGDRPVARREAHHAAHAAAGPSTARGSARIGLGDGHRCSSMRVKSQEFLKRTSPAARSYVRSVDSAAVRPVVSDVDLGAAARLG